MRILIADDESSSRRVLEVTLRRLGHDVVVVSDGVQALETLSGDGEPRLAILDWMMPGLDGLEVCRRLRERGGRYVYLILLTARSTHKDMLKALEADVDDFLAKPFDTAELKARLRSGQRVLDLQEGLLRTQRELSRLATQDHLTNILNRRAVVEAVDIELARASRDEMPLSLMIADLDHFKRVNDKYGHAAGDAVLADVAQRMRSVLRAHDVIGRYGGDEFLIVLPRCDATEAADVANRAVQSVRSITTKADGAALKMTVSVGVATCSYGALSGAAELMAAADRALYQAKAAGRNRVEQLSCGADISHNASGLPGSSSGISARNPGASRTETSHTATSERGLDDTPGASRTR